MSIALSSLLILILAFPGHAARMAYLAEDFTRDALPRSITSDIVRAIIYALPFHVVGILFMNLILSYAGQPTVGLEPFLRIMAAEYGENGKTIQVMAANTEQHYLLFGVYSGTLTALGFVVGAVLRDQVWKRRWDVHYPELFGYNNDWLYIFTGRTHFDESIDGIVDVLVDIRQKTRLYRGVVYSFTTDDDGSLQEITVIYALRGKFKDEGGGKQTFYWEDIPGTYFVIKYSDVINLNITYADLSQARNPALAVRALHQKKKKRKQSAASPAPPSPSL